MAAWVLRRVPLESGCCRTTKGDSAVRLSSTADLEEAEMKRISVFSRALPAALVLPLILSSGLALSPSKGEDPAQNVIRKINRSLAAQGEPLRLAVVEYLAAPGSDAVGRTVIFEDRGFQLEQHFVPGDPRRGGFMDIAWLVDLADGATANGLTAAQTDAAIGRAMETWQQANCSKIPLFHLGSFNLDFGLVQFLLGFGGSSNVFADITHAGWLPSAFFNQLEPGGGNSILGITFTFVFVDPATGIPTDVNQDGKLDAAFREIYYNNNFFWQIGGNVDVETVALHEAGHGLSQAHFGKLFQTDANGSFHFAPRSAMNAGYTGVQQALTGTDRAGHCTLWGSWPNQ